MKENKNSNYFKFKIGLLEQLNRQPDKAIYGGDVTNKYVEVLKFVGKNDSKKHRHQIQRVAEYFKDELGIMKTSEQVKDEGDYAKWEIKEPFKHHINFFQTRIFLDNLFKRRKKHK